MKNQGKYLVKKALLIWTLMQLTVGMFSSYAQETLTYTPIRDLFPDTWVATDGLGRTMPGYAEVGPIKTDQPRVVGMFYITWHDDGKAHMNSPYAGDVSKVLAQDPTARLNANHPLWKEGSYHWGEPETGYFLSKDEYVIRKDMSMLADAGVDVLVIDVTNAVRYWDEWDVLFPTMEKMKAEGNKVPKICFWAFNGPVITVVQDLYDRIYKTGKYKDLWFYWEGKPLLLYNGYPEVDANGKGVKNPNPHFDPTSTSDANNAHYGDRDYTEENYKDYTKDVKHFFTLRTMWWGYYQWAGKRFIGTEDNWSFGYDMGNKNVQSLPPDSLVSRHHGQIEEAAVTPGQHPASTIGKSWRRQTGEPPLNQYDLPDSAYVPWLGKKVHDPQAYGIYFQDRWDEALKVNPKFLYINDWNEWTAGKYQPKEGKTFHFMGRENSYYFVDQYNAEFNRSIQPMKGGYTDNYYMQMAQNIRRYKGVRPIPELKGTTKIDIDGNFADWKNVSVEYRDTRGDIIHRDYPGYGGHHYTDTSGRNDILTSKVAVDPASINFYAETAGNLSPYTGENWMLLLIDADQNPKTGWFGYDFLINKRVINNHQTALLCYDQTTAAWKQAAVLPYKASGNQLEISVPRRLLGLQKDKFSFDFKWSDHSADLKDPVSLCLEGDAAPNRRFNYRCIWKK